MRTTIDEAIESEYRRQGKYQQYLEHLEKHSAANDTDDPCVLQLQQKLQLRQLFQKLVVQGHKELRIHRGLGV